MDNSNIESKEQFQTTIASNSNNIEIEQTITVDITAISIHEKDNIDNNINITLIVEPMILISQLKQNILQQLNILQQQQQPQQSQITNPDEFGIYLGM